MKIIQISDMHLYQNLTTQWRERINTYESFEKTLNHAVEHEKPDVIILSGDLSEDGSIESYKNLSKLIDSVGIKTYCIPGNHDCLKAMNDVFPSDFLYFQHDVDLGNWQVVFVNSVVEGKHHGYLTLDELNSLENTLQKNKDKHIAITVHHNPVSTYSPVLDLYSLTNSNDFFKVIEPYTNVKIILYGHIHQDYTTYKKNVLLLGCPASCIQFSPKAKSFTLDKLPPGYRWIQLHTDGSLDTGSRYL
jgi:Icc protein